MQNLFFKRTTKLLQKVETVPIWFDGFFFDTFHILRSGVGGYRDGPVKAPVERVQRSDNTNIWVMASSLTGEEAW